MLADQEHVLERARRRGFLTGELQPRVAFAPCNFFENVPGGCRAYLMKNVIHDWDQRGTSNVHEVRVGSKKLYRRRPCRGGSKLFRTR